MKLLITLEKPEQRQAIGRIIRACQDHNVKIELPAWEDNQSCSLEIYASQLSEELQSEIKAIAKDDSVRKHAFAA